MSEYGYKEASDDLIKNLEYLIKEKKNYISANAKKRICDMQIEDIHTYHSVQMQIVALMEVLSMAKMLKEKAETKDW